VSHPTALSPRVVNIFRGRRYEYCDIANRPNPAAGHVKGLEVRFLELDHVTLRYHFAGAGKESDELVDLRGKT
jgi:hypothetical protein